MTEYKVIGYRYGTKSEYADFESLDEAVSFCYWSIEDNEMMPISIVCPDGREIKREVLGPADYEGELQDLIDEYGDKVDLGLKNNFNR